MPGPAPKPDDQRRRRNATPQTTKLPAEGRKGKPPEWPLTKPTKAETEAWRQVWATPQAAAWEKLGWVRTVARYVRLLVQSEKKDATASICGEVRQMEDRLGLTPMAMLRLRWQIVEDEVSEARASAPGTGIPDRWAGLQVVDGN